MVPQMTALGAGSPITIARAVGGSASPLPPSAIASVAPGSSLTYNIEIAGDPLDPVTKQFPAPTPGFPSTWVPLPGGIGLTASVVVPINVQCTGCRINVTSFQSGSVGFAVCQ